MFKFKNKSEVTKKIEKDPPKKITNVIQKKNLETEKKNKVEIDKTRLAKIQTSHWNPDNYVITNVSMPQEIGENGKIKKRFKIKLEFKDQKGQQHKKTIRFGKHGIKEYIDDGDEKKREKLYSKLGNTHNPFHSNFWRLHLLNQSEDLKENWMNLLNKI